MVEHQDVRLLHDLCTGDTVVPEQQVGGNRSPWREFGDDERLEIVEPGELFVDPGRGVVTVDKRGRSVEPERLLALAMGASNSAAHSAALRRFHRAITFV